MWCTGSSSTAVTPSDVRYSMAASEARPGVGAAQVLAHAGVPLREALHVQLVDDGLVPGRLERPVALPVEAGSITTQRGIAAASSRAIRQLAVLGRAGHVGQRVRGLPAHAAVDRLGVRIDQQLGGVEAVPALGRVGAVDAAGRSAGPGPTPGR